MMLHKLGLSIALFTTLGLAHTAAAAPATTPAPASADTSAPTLDTTNIETMAGIVMNMNHFPDDAEKKELSSIASNAKSDAEKTIATAILNIKHAPSPADKAKLELIAADPNAAAPVRDLASIIADFNHQVTEADIARLKHIK